MIKLKLQRAVFKLSHISNDTISSELIAGMFDQDLANSPHINLPNKPINHETFNPSNKESFQE